MFLLWLSAVPFALADNTSDDLYYSVKRQAYINVCDIKAYVKVNDDGRIKKSVHWLSRSTAGAGSKIKPEELKDIYICKSIEITEEGLQESLLFLKKCIEGEQREQVEYGLQWNSDDNTHEVSDVSKDRSYLSLFINHGSSSFKMTANDGNKVTFKMENEKLRTHSTIDFYKKQIKRTYYGNGSFTLVSYDGAFKCSDVIVAYPGYRFKYDVSRTGLVDTQIPPQIPDVMRLDSKGLHVYTKLISGDYWKSVNLDVMVLAYLEFFPDKKDPKTGQLRVTPLIEKKVSENTSYCKALESKGSGRGMGFIRAQREDVEEIFVDHKNLVIKLKMIDMKMPEDTSEGLEIKIDMNQWKFTKTDNGGFTKPPKGFGCDVKNEETRDVKKHKV